MTTPRRDLATTEPPTPAAAPERPQSKGWFPELADVLFELTKTYERSVLTFIYMAVALAVCGAMLAWWSADGRYYPVILTAVALLSLALLVSAVAGGYFIWVSVRDVARWLIARQRNRGGIMAATAPERRKSASWFSELGNALYDQCQTAQRVLYWIGVVTLAAIAAVYLGEYTGALYLKAGGAVVFGLSGLAWAAATCYMVAVLVRIAVLWRAGRMR